MDEAGRSDVDGSYTSVDTDHRAGAGRAGGVDLCDSCAGRSSGTNTVSSTVSSTVTTLRLRTAVRFAAQSQDQRVVSRSEHTGAMVALFLDPATALQIALATGEPAEELHVTLAYLGEAADIEDVELLQGAIAAFAERQVPLLGSLNAVLRMDGNSGQGNGDPFCLTLDCPELPQFRQTVTEVCTSAGVPPDRTHGFIPHVTLDYLQVDDSDPFERIDAIPVRFDEVWLCLAGEYTPYQLGISSEKYGTAGWFHDNLKNALLQRVQRAVDDTTDDSDEEDDSPVDLTAQAIEGILSTLSADAYPPARSDIDAAIKQYEQGKVTASQLSSMISDIYGASVDDWANDADTSDQRKTLVLSIGAMSGASAGLSTLDGSAVPQTTARSAVAQTSRVADVEFNGKSKATLLLRASRDLIKESTGIVKNFATGDSSAAQTAQQLRSAYHGATWYNYQDMRNALAADQGLDGAWWETDDPKSGSCDDCAVREEESPYQIDDLPGIPGDGSTQCDFGCVCHVRYGMLTAEDVGDSSDEEVQRYSDDEPRDEKGQWTSGGDAAGVNGDAARIQNEDLRGAVDYSTLDVATDGDSMFGINATLVTGLDKSRLERPDSHDLSGEPSRFADDPTNYTDNITRAEVKEEIASNLADRMAADEEFRQYVLVKDPYAAESAYAFKDAALRDANTFAGSWAATASDTDPAAVAMQYAVRDVFGLEDTAEPWTKQSEGARLQELAQAAYQDRGAVMRAYVRAEYQNTQAFLKAQGITGNVTLVRGLDPGPRYEINIEPQTASFRGQPVSSWSTNVGVASEFGIHVLFASVPVERILSTSRTGSGCLPEAEIRVLGGRDKVTFTSQRGKVTTREYAERIGVPKQNLVRYPRQ